MNGFSLTTVLVLINILCLGLTLMMTQWLSVFEVISTADVHLYLILLVSSGICSVLLILTGIVKLRRPHTKPNGAVKNHRYQYVPYVGLYIFGIGAIILNLLELAVDIQCTSIYKNHTIINSSLENSPNVTKQLHRLAYNNDVFSALDVFKSFSTIFQMSFLVRFRDYKAASRKSKLCIMMILAANASLYIFTFLQETKDRLPNQATSIDLEIETYAKSHNLTDLESCVGDPTGLKLTLKDVEPYFYPFDMEFCLVAVGMLFSMILINNQPEIDHQVGVDDNNSQSNINISSTQTDVHSTSPSTSSAGEITTEGPDSNNGSVEDDAPLITSPGSDLREDEIHSELVSDNSTTRESNLGNNSCTFAFNLAILLSLIVIILEAICNEQWIHERIIIVFYVARLLYYCLLLGTTITAAVIICSKFKIQSKAFHSETVLLLVAATGEFVYLYFGILAATAAFGEEEADEMYKQQSVTAGTTHHPSETRERLIIVSWLNFFSNIIDILQIGIQTFLLIMTKGMEGRLQVHSPNLTDRQKHALLEIMWYLCTCNFFKWITDSFIEGHFLKTSESKTLVFGDTKWTAITQTTYPLVLFYRFHSVHMILRVADNLFN